MRKSIVMMSAALAGVTALAGCGSGGDGTTAAGPKKSPQPTPSGLQISGIVVLDESTAQQADYDEPEFWTLRVFSPKDGENTLNLTIPVTDVAAGGDAVFSANWQFAAWAGNDKAIHIFRLDPASRQYQPYKTITPPKSSYSGGTVTYKNAVFAPAGKRLWFAAVPDEGKTKLLSVDFRSPGDPREELTLRDGEPRYPGYRAAGWQLLPGGTVVQVVEHDYGDAAVSIPPREDLYLHDGQSAREIGKRGDTEYVRYVTVDGTIVDGDLTVKVPETGDYGTYHFVGAVDSQTMLLAISDPSRVPEAYGAVVAVRIDPNQGNATVTSVAKGGAGTLHDVALAPDKKRVLLINSEGWFLQTLGSGGDPQPLRKPLTTTSGFTSPVTLLDWT